jgi:hypothetical protein
VCVHLLPSGAPLSPREVGVNSLEYAHLNRERPTVYDSLVALGRLGLESQHPKASRGRAVTAAAERAGAGVHAGAHPHHAQAVVPAGPVVGAAPRAHPGVRKEFHMPFDSPV